METRNIQTFNQPIFNHLSNEDYQKENKNPKDNMHCSSFEVNTCTFASANTNELINET